jgi:hypothetical protein
MLGQREPFFHRLVATLEAVMGATPASLATSRKVMAPLPLLLRFEISLSAINFFAMIMVPLSFY